jgi:prepilin-type N-terminal cleavage/methylation domain-containing protein
VLKDRRRRGRRGFSLIELLIVIAIILVILAMALPRLNTARRGAYETGAIKAITTIHTAQAQYYSQFGKYAESLAVLGPPASGAPNASASDLLPGDLSKGEKGGYRFELQLKPETGGYVVNASPTAFGTSGSRTFFSDQSLTIRQHFGPEPATIESEEIK